MRKADEAEDDAKFAPAADIGEKYTSPPTPRSPTSPISPTSRASVTDRISQRLREKLGDAKAPAVTPTPPEKDKGKGRAVEPPLASPEQMSPVETAPPPPPKIVTPGPILLGDIMMAPEALSVLLIRAKEELPLRSVRLPIIGEYTECFSGEEFTTWLKDNIKDIQGDLDKAESAAIDICETHNLLRRIGELGNRFESTPEAFYQFRPKAFNVEGREQAGSGDDVVAVANNLLKRTNTLASFISKNLGTGTGGTPYQKARTSALAAENEYRTAVRQLDRQRLGLEERIDATLKELQKMETDRLRGVKTVLLQYQGVLANLPSSLQPTLDRSSVLLSSFQPESDVMALIERYRTGPFRPVAHVFESMSHDYSDVVFGIDLRKWAGEGGWNAVRAGGKEKGDIPESIKELLDVIAGGYGKLPSDDERRKTWIYEVPLPAVHHCREAIISHPVEQPLAETLAKYDLPVLASTVKLWALELDPPLGLWEGWDDVRKIYPSVGADVSEERPGIVDDLKAALARLPKIHILVLDAIVKHLKTLIDTTKSEESNDTYIMKLALSMGRTILRPKVETEISIQDRHATRLFIDLLKHYDAVIPPTIEAKKRESDRRALVTRKRTAPVDLRLNRSSISAGSDPQQLLKAQMQMQNPRSRDPSPARPAADVPPLPTQTASDDKRLHVPPAEKSPSTNEEETEEEESEEEEETEEEESEEGSEGSKPKSDAPVIVSPPSPAKPLSPPAGAKDINNEPISRGPASLSRTTSNEASRLRGPRIARGPRAPGGGSVSPAPGARPTHTSGPSRSSVSSVGGGERERPPANPSDYAPRRTGGRATAGAFANKDADH
jgi:hypothetical protein